MTSKTSNKRSWMRALRIAAIGGAIMMAVGACAHMVQMFAGTGAERPAEEEFGLGPRASANGMYRAELRPATTLKPRTMQKVSVAITDATGSPVDGASVLVDGGMPQHGHGLPTKPRVTRNNGSGVYEIDGVRFNMGGWWEFKLAISGPAGSDTVTFNLSL